MRKYLIGALFGIALTIASSAFADDIKSLIGSKIQGEFPVTINGQALEKKALIVDGGSYLPVRDMGDALGLDVTFNADMGIELKQKESTEQEVSPVETTDLSKTVTNVVFGNDTLEFYNTRIASYNDFLKNWNVQLKSLTDEGYGDSIQATKIKDNISKAELMLEETEQKKAELEN